MANVTSSTAVEVLPSQRPSLLLGLPSELLYVMFAEDVLTVGDLKNLRLVHPTLTGLLAPVHFHQITIKFGNSKYYAPEDRHPRFRRYSWYSDNEESDLESEDQVLDAGVILRDEDGEDIEGKCDDMNDNDKRCGDGEGEGGVGVGDNGEDGNNNDEEHSTLHHTKNLTSQPQSRPASKADLLRAIRGRVYSDEFFSAVRVLVLDTLTSEGISVINSFINWWNTSTDFTTWFPNLTCVFLKVRMTKTKDQAKFATNLIKTTTRNTPSHVELRMMLVGVTTHRACIQEIKNTSWIEIYADPRTKFDKFCEDLAGAISRSESLTHLALRMPYDKYDDGKFPVNLKNLFGNVAAENLSAVKSLELFMSVHDNDTEGHQISKMVALEALNVKDWTDSNEIYRSYGTLAEESSPNTIWDHLRTTAIKIKDIKVGYCDKTLIRYLATLQGKLEHLEIVAKFESGSRDRKQHENSLKQSRDHFWYGVFPRVASTLRTLTIMTKRYFRREDGIYATPLEIPIADKSLHQYFINTNLEHVELEIFCTDSCLVKFLSLFTIAAKLRTFRLDIYRTNPPEMLDEHTDNYEEYMRNSYENERSGRRYIKRARDVTANVIINAHDNEKSIRFKAGVIIEMKLFFKEFLDFPFIPLKFRSEGTHLYRYPDMPRY